MTTPSQHQLLSVKEVVAEYGMSEPLWNRLRGTGGGPKYLKIKSSVRYRRSEIERWLNEQQRDSTAASESTDDRALSPHPRK